MNFTKSIRTPAPGTPTTVQLYAPAVEIVTAPRLPSRAPASLDRANWRAGLITFLMVAFLAVSCAFADLSQEVFPTPDAAASALVAAAKAGDLVALNLILGPDGNQIISSGDPVADKNAREDFVRRYNQMHRLAYDAEGKVVLYIGAENWPTPIPLVQKDGGWTFDTAAGKNELLYRRIGKNELFTINVLRNLADAEHEYATSKNRFAERILSTPGQQNGLYWKTAEGQPESPIGPLVADASVAGYRRGANNAMPPFHGYYYKVLTRQGKNAPGGAKNYIVDGKMTNGFAFLAFPADYRSSGVMTFMINWDGIVVQKDLGPDTGKLASSYTEFNPDKSWDQVLEEVDEEDNN